MGSFRPSFSNRLKLSDCSLVAIRSDGKRIAVIVSKVVSARLVGGDDQRVNRLYLSQFETRCGFIPWERVELNNVTTKSVVDRDFAFRIALWQRVSAEVKREMSLENPVNWASFELHRFANK